ncbi:MAG TPA: tetratricopeptide repeat protein [Verrucomicrobiae bacterium]|nr:tetratricopeptide repeat protein [Verrucomicrobiae bacterium]
MKRQKQRPSNPNSEPRLFTLRDWLFACGLLAAIILAYLRACTGEFIWDDDANVTKNFPLRTLAGLRAIWLQPGATQQYYPLTHTSFWLDFHAWGLQPFGYHAVNILLHAASAILLFAILKRLRVPGAWLGAALFALHPVQAESVAWITERKNTLAGVFFLASLLAAIKFWLLGKTTGENSNETTAASFGPWKYYSLALIFYLCALWSKTATIGLPAVIFLLIWWRRRTIIQRDFALLAPFVIVGSIMGAITIWIEKNDLGAAGSDWQFSLAQRLYLAGRIFWFYLGKLAWPHPLMFVYPRWNIASLGAISFLPLAGALAIVLFLWTKRQSWGRPILFGIGYFVVMLFPVLGFFDVYFFRFSFVCDHFQYLASMGALALAGAGISVALNHFRHRVTLIIPALILCGLSFLMWRQTAIYHDRATLWHDTLAHNPDAWLAHSNLGSLFLQRGDTAEAIAEFQISLGIRPEDAATHNNLGGIFLKIDRLKDALEEFRTALKLDPNFAAAHVNLGNALLQSGMINEAIATYERALQLEPDDLAAHVNLGDALFHQNRAEEAAAHYQKAIQLAQDTGRTKLAQQLSDELMRQRNAHSSPH